MTGPLQPPERRVIYISQGEIAVDRAQDVVITAVLGSCVAVCLHDPLGRIGGMNHILLPQGSGAGALSEHAAVNAMETLINALTKAGACRHQLCAKIFGGAHLIGRHREIGARNAAFAQKFLRTEGLPCCGGSIGGRSARRIEFRPFDGSARQKLVRGTPQEIAPARHPQGGGLELF